MKVKLNIKWFLLGFVAGLGGKDNKLDNKDNKVVDKDNKSENKVNKLDKKLKKRKQKIYNDNKENILSKKNVEENEMKY